VPRALSIGVVSPVGVRLRRLSARFCVPAGSGRFLSQTIRSTPAGGRRFASHVGVRTGYFFRRMEEIAGIRFFRQIIKE
jgi:hypothetical protein